MVQALRTDDLSDRGRVATARQLGGTAALVAYYTPFGVALVFTAAVFTTARLIFGPGHAAAHWWGLGLGLALSAAIIARGLHRLTAHSR